ncbi:BZ3500_MvSof-1268-A1-R1_Chr3-1g05789 [Microbotryum saponariae]|uniref:BZ3500_MvSof-1268-A1-R1_Chr3-1g05789 protein n=1 Tax=Microbotryum saponariae TaxID=289078 RepID=A0A2X0LS20_9BASI|nr:BZ3500_MvSof-1268-A1-R1_Chr3-1g05789 [Microbotryum saponariae]SDA04979.1 BZ3501_MvSof-1269-A2-R1_Chr3-1g05459 [Microbotryum saponariae]
MVQRVTLRTRKSYNTKSNGKRIVKTPGGSLRYLTVKKAASAPKCGDCKIALPGVSPLTWPFSTTSQHEYSHCSSVLQIPALRPRQYAQISKRQKTVQRAYGGSRCANCVRDRIVRSFLVEEAKIVKKVRNTP